MDNQQNKSQAPWPAMHVKVVPHRLTNLLSQDYTSNETKHFFCWVYLSKGFRIIVCWPYVHILFIWYLDLWMHNTRSPPIPKKNSYILNIWSSCGQIGALLVKIRRKSRVLDNPEMILQLSIEKIHLLPYHFFEIQLWHQVCCWHTAMSIFHIFRPTSSTPPIILWLSNHWHFRNW